MADQTQFSYGILPEQAQEDALHATRLLNIEERPFQRASKPLLGKDSPLRWTPKQLPSPPPDGEEEQAQTQETEEAARRQKIHDDILLDFVALESSTIRIQMIQDSNQRERERYAAEKAKILETAQAVRENSIQLRAQLAEAQKILEQRKGYDDLAKRLLPDDEKLKPRDVCNEEIEKLRKEIDELKHEDAAYKAAWAPRREAFDRVMAEGQAMLRQIKGIKDEPEPEPEADKDERMEEGDEDEEGLKESRSHDATPVPEGATPLPEGIGGETPMPHEGGEEDADSVAKPTNRFLDVEGVFANGSIANSPAATPAGDVPTDTEMEGGEHSVDNNSVADQAATPAVDVADEMDES